MHITIINYICCYSMYRDYNLTCYNLILKQYKHYLNIQYKSNISHRNTLKLFYIPFRRGWIPRSHLNIYLQTNGGCHHILIWH